MRVRSDSLSAAAALEVHSALKASLQAAPIHPLWRRATAAASIALLFFFTLAQAVHSHGTLPDLKSRHHVTAGLAESPATADQCPLCVGGVHLFIPGTASPSLQAALVRSGFFPSFAGHIPSVDLPFALSSRPPPSL